MGHWSISGLIGATLLAILYLVYRESREHVSGQSAELMDHIYLSASGTVETLLLIGTIATVVGFFMWIANQA